MVHLVLTSTIMFVILVLTLISICWTTHIIISDFNKHVVVAGVGGSSAWATSASSLSLD